MSEPVIRNGVNVTALENLVSGVKENPEMANVTFKAKSSWKGGTQTHVKISDLIAGGNNIAGEDRKFELTVDEPEVLGGTDEHPNPVEYLAAGLSGCLTAGIASNAALFETELDAIDVEVDVEFDIHGLLGLDREIPSGALELTYKVKLKGPEAKEKLMKSKDTIDRKSPVKKTLELPLKINTEVEVEES
ncbi:MAG: OsmC family protein [Bacteroidota bacterium]